MPLGSMMLPDHPMCEYDSLHEKSDSKVNGLVHRYPDKALFLGRLATTGLIHGNYDLN